MPLSLVPVMAKGASSPPFRPAIVAPIARSGFTTRPIGRRLIDSSPVRIVKKSCPANSPAIKRIPVPELPQSMGPNGSVNPHMPLP